MPANYFVPPVTYAFDNFWLNRDGIQDAFSDLWRMIATRFRDDPMTLGYDMFNEPWPGSQWSSCANQSGCPAFDIQVLQPAQDAWAAAIREVDTDKVIFYEPHLLFGQGAGSWLTTPPDGIAPVALSYHALCLARATNQTGLPDQVTDSSQSACPQTDELIVSNAEAVSNRLGGPAVMTELQAANHEDFAKLECIIEAAERGTHGWTNGLSWRSGGELRRMNPDNPDLVGRMKVLSRPYPRALNGDIIRHGFDPRTRSYDLEFSPGQATSGHSSLFVPVEVHYPNGYVATVEGGRVVSNPNTSTLHLIADPGVVNVTLSIEPPVDDPTEGLDIPTCDVPPADGSNPGTGGST